MKINYYRYNTQIIFHFILFLFLFNQSNCLIEFPLEVLISHQNNISQMKTKIGTNLQKSNNNNFLRFLIEEGVTKINSNHLFLANIKIGSESQPFRLILDTGSSITWIADISSNIDTSLKISNYFDPSTSKSCTVLRETFNIKYGTGECSGYFCIDTIKYLNNKQFKLKLGLARTALFDFEEADGIIGLSRFNDDMDTSFINRLYLDKIIDSRMFSLKFASNNLQIPMGKMFIGRHDDFNKKNSFSCDLVETKDENKYFWTCKLQAFHLKQSNQLLSSNYTVNIIFDTGTNFIFLPFEYIQEMEPNLNKIGCKIIEYTDDSKTGNNFDKMGFQNAFRLACSNNIPQAQFTLGNTTFFIPGELTFYYENGFYYSYILFVIANQQGVNPYIFGSPFFMSFHTLFNHEDKKMEFYPLDAKYIVNYSGNIFSKIIVIIAIISLWLILFFMIFYYIRIKRIFSKDEYHSVSKHDINIEMFGKNE